MFGIIAKTISLLFTFYCICPVEWQCWAKCWAVNTITSCNMITVPPDSYCKYSLGDCCTIQKNRFCYFGRFLYITWTSNYIPGPIKDVWGEHIIFPLINCILYTVHIYLDTKCQHLTIECKLCFVLNIVNISCSKFILISLLMSDRCTSMCLYQ